MSRMRTATEIGLAICGTISEDTLKFIEEWDPDLHYALVQARKKRTRRSRKNK
jgi:hypothetical protein